MADKLEKEFEADLRRLVSSYGGMCLKWVCPGWVGVPDRLVLLPGGRVLFVELKQPGGGRIGAMQLWWRRRLIDLGMDHFFLRSEEDLHALEYLIRYGGGGDD